MLAYLAIISLIGNVLSVVLAGWAVYEANAGGRLIILALLVLTFLIPALWSSSPVNLICFTGRIILGIGCFIYLKWQRDI
jgi:ABC-type glycerol-3-phosphate transport system permease component